MDNKNTKPTTLQPSIIDSLKKLSETLGGLSAQDKASINKSQADTGSSQPPKQEGYNYIGQDGRTYNSRTFQPVDTGTQTADASNKPNTYTATSGDTVPEIAKKNNTNIQAVMDANKSLKTQGSVSSGLKVNIPTPVAPPQGTDKSLASLQQNIASKIQSVPDQKDSGQVRGAASSLIQDYTKPEDTSFQDTMNTALADLTNQSKQNITNSINEHQTSLLSDYNKMASDAGLTTLDKNVINMKNVIEGTEDDVRTEIMKAGGFATESQIQAMTAQRNKTLIKSYNSMLDERNAIADNIKTQLGYEEKDQDTKMKMQEQANTLAEKMLGIQDKMSTYQEKIRTNSVSQYNKIVDNVGYKGLASALKDSPYEKQLAGELLGVNLDNAAQLDTFKEKNAELAQQRLGQQALKISLQQSGGFGTAEDTKDLVSQDAQAVLEGRDSVQNIRLSMGRSNQAMGYMRELRSAINKIDPQFDYNLSNAGTKAVSSQFYQKSIAAVNSVLPNLDKFTEISNQVPRIGLKAADALIQKGKMQIGNTKVSSLHQMQKLIGDEIGLALGGGTMSDMKLQLGFDVTDPSVTPEVFAQNMETVKEFVNNRKGALESLRYKSSTTGGSKYSVDGKTYNIPSDKVDAFMKKYPNAQKQ